MTGNRHLLRTVWWRRRWVQLAATAVAAALLGATGEHFAHALTEQPESHHTATRTVVRAPDGCLAALDEADRALERALMFGEGMRDLSKSDHGVHTFEKEGSHYENSVRHVDTITTAIEQFRQHKTACRAG